MSFLRMVTITLILLVTFSCKETGKKIYKHTQQPLFNIPRLIGKDIPKVKSIMGQPDLQNTGGADDVGAIIYEKQGYQLVVSFNKSTRMTTDFFLSLDAQDYPEDFNVYLKVGRLSLKDTALYTIQPQRSMNDPSLFTGINIYPATPRRDSINSR